MRQLSSLMGGEYSSRPAHGLDEGQKRDHGSSVLGLSGLRGTARRRISLATQGSTVGHFNMDDIGWMRVAVPDIEVQRQLVSKIEDANSDANEAIDKTQSEIALLHEFRTRLVADVVTGQVDVRSIVATLPDAPEATAELAADSDDEFGDLQEEGL